MKKIIIFTLLAISFNLVAFDATTSSPTKTITTTFTEAVDQYLDVIDFNLLDTSVLFLQFDAPTESSSSSTPLSPFTIGMGNRYGENLYLGWNLSIENPGSDEVESSTLSTTLQSDGLTNQGRIDKLTTDSTTTKDSKYDFSLTTGLNIKSFTLGLNGFVSYDESASGTTTHIGAVSMGTPTTISTYNTLPTISISTSSTKAVVDNIYDNKGNLSETIVTNVNPASDGYINNINLKYGIVAGTQLKLSNFKLDIRAFLNMNVLDKSQKGENLNYVTNYENNFKDFMGIKNPSSVVKTNAEIIDIRNRLTTRISVSTMLPVLDNFDFETGLIYSLESNIYTNGGITKSYTNVDYSANNTIDGIITTSKTTNQYDIKSEISDTTNLVILPLTFTSNFSDRFVIAIKNLLTYSLNTNTTTNSGSASETIVTSNSSSLVNDTKKVTTNNYYNDTTDVTTHKINNTIYAGAKFYLTDKVRINLGSTVVLNPFKLINTRPGKDGFATQTIVELIDGEEVTTNTKVDSNKTPSKTNTDDSTLPSSVIYYKAGMTYFLNENLQLDLQYGMESVTGTIWTPGNWKLLLTAKF